MTEDERRAVEGLFARYSEGVGSFLLARVGDAELAEEITARVFHTVVRKFAQCRRSPAAWLWAIVRTALAEHFRRRRPHEPADPQLPDGAAGPDEQAERLEMQRRTRAALAKLPEDTQKIIYMKFYQDMRNVEIAKATGLTPSNVGVLVHRSLKRLRALIESAPPHSGTGALS